MRFYFLVAVLFLLSLTPSYAALEEWDVDVSVNTDGSNDWIIKLTYNESVAKSDYFVLSRIFRVEVLANNQTILCDVTEDIGTSIVCDDIHASEVIYKFHTKDFVDNIRDLKMFRYPFSVTQVVGKMNIALELPLGTALVEESQLTGTGLKPFDPNFGRQGSDGRRIFIEWEFDKPTLGQTINISAIYEILGGFDPFTLFFVILALIVIAFLTILWYYSKRHNVKNILPVLTEGERKVMEILLREKGTVDQRVIVKETDFSKAKVTRVINDLEKRGIVEKVSKGRKNLIKLKKEVKQLKQQNEKQEKDK